MSYKNKRKMWMSVALIVGLAIFLIGLGIYRAQAAAPEEKNSTVKALAETELNTQLNACDQQYDKKCPAEDKQRNCPDEQDKSCCRKAAKSCPLSSAKACCSK